MTAAVLTGAGFGTALSWQTEIAHRVPYRYTHYADLTMRAPDAGVPAMLLQVDRVNEPVNVSVSRVRRYVEWFELLAPMAGKTAGPAVAWRTIPAAFRLRDLPRAVVRPRPRSRRARHFRSRQGPIRPRPQLRPRRDHSPRSLAPRPTRHRLHLPHKARR